MTEVFADAFYYIAMLNPTDHFHSPAINLSKTLTRPVVMTVWILMEVADALSDPAVRGRTYRFLQMVKSHPGTTVVAEVEPWWSRGLALYGRRPDKSWSLTDCISFEVMSDRGITEALTGDHHFAQAGFQALLQPQNP
jgi:predicted nucleic acid-binding protein